MAILTDRDERTWRGLCGRVAVDVERRLDQRVLANRAVAAPEGWRLEPLGRSLDRARRGARELSLGGRPLLLTDVASFYASVSPQVLARTLRSADADPSDARLAADLLDGWGSHGYAGLPIGPPGSAVLANAVLCGLDQALAGLRFLRWVDDVLVALPDDLALGHALERVDEALGRVGLTRANDKTFVVASPSLRWPGTPATGRASCSERAPRAGRGRDAPGHRVRRP